jgi:hypothetical protein
MIIASDYDNNDENSGGYKVSPGRKVHMKLITYLATNYLKKCETSDFHGDEDSSRGLWVLTPSSDVV